MKKEPLIIIPARAGSKGIPNKNIRNLGGFPLISYVIRSAIRTKLSNNIIVSTDSMQIKNIAEKYGALVPFLRPKSLATDTSKTIDAIRFTILKLLEQKKQFDDLILLQPTQPFISEQTIINCYTFYNNHNRIGVAGISRVREHPILMRTRLADETLHPILSSQEGSTIRRQDMPTIYKVNGSIYINRISDILSEDLSFNDNPLGFITPDDEGFDIDTPLDLKIANFLISKK